jgi:hypothetical protein
MVVELQEAIKRGLQRAAAGEVLAPERDAPVLVQDGLLQALDEAIGLGMPRPRRDPRNSGNPPARSARARRHESR